MGADVGRKDRDRDMTPEKAIEYLEITKTCAGDDHKGYLIKEMCSSAIAALEEIQQYRKIGTVEECKEAVQKQKPRGCMLESKGNCTNYKCPSCGQIKLSIYKMGNRFVRLKGITKYCENCGQALLDEDLQTPTGEQVE